MFQDNLVCFSMKEFENMTKDWILNKEDGETEETCPWKITTNELTNQKSKVNKTASRVILCNTNDAWPRVLPYSLRLTSLAST